MKKFLGLLLLLVAIPVVAGVAGVLPRTFSEVQYEYNFGKWSKDPFRWMENRDNPKLYTWIRDQNAHTRSFLSGPIFEDLKTDFQKIYGGLSESADQVDDFEEMINKNRRAPLSRVGRSPNSPDDRYKVEMLRDNRTDFSVARIYDNEQKVFLKDHLFVKFAGIYWEEGSTSFIYTSDFDGRMGNAYPSLFRHRVGSSQLEDELIYEAPTPDTWISIYSLNGKWILEESRNEVTSVSEIDVNTRVRRVILAGLKNRFLSIDFTETEIIAISDDKEDMGEIIAISLATGAIETKVKAREIPIAAAAVDGSTILASYIRDAASETYFYDLKNNTEKKIDLPGVGQAVPTTVSAGKINIAWTTYAASGSVWTLDQNEFKFVLESSSPALAFELEAERVFYVAHNGQKAPIWIVKKKGLILSPETPAYLYGYGGFSVNLLPAAGREIMPWLKRGGIFAVVTLPGGLEYGEAWHKAGMLHNKKNVFRDFAMAAKTLVANGLTSHERIAISGASNGGTLVGATMSLYPDLFKAAVPQVGVMDMTMFKEHTGGKWWVSEYGDSDNQADYEYLLKYSPYHILRNGKLPHTLVMTGDMDDRVVPSHSYKFAAKLQSLKNNPSRSLIYTQRNASHSSSTGAAKDVVEGMTSKWTFIINATSGKFD